ncbi:carboxylating nicotinate-nucleotide diphosphorylase [Candidatus Woesearchaeota archaeon]|nr:carboxylating nicotinate-nucleotide diphosphorylase [Candidatus Woesearchaeota archaeon]
MQGMVFIMMDREELLNKGFQRGHLLTVKNELYRDWIKKFIIDETKGDIGKGDITSNAVLRDGRVKAIVYSRSDGIIAGVEEVLLLLKDSGIKARIFMKDGSRVKKGSKILLLEGKGKDILKLERSVLDLLSRMSGIATLTNDLIRNVRGMIAIAPTRKTQWRYLDKKAVYVGGGMTHRLALWESILIKDNHLDALRKENVKDVIGTALERAWKNRRKGIFVEIETMNEEEAVRAAKKFKELGAGSSSVPCLVMLDNMEPEKIRGIIGKMKRQGLLKNVLVEASGGINPSNIGEYAKSGADVLSLGYLTTSSRALDMKLKII